MPERARRDDSSDGSRREGPAVTLAVVFLNGEYEDEAFYRARFAAASLVVAADGGHSFLRRQGLWPHVLAGDFDSLDEAAVAEAAAAGGEVVRQPPRKDETDAEIAVALAEERGADRIELLGGLGGAVDHVLGHVCVLRGLAERGRAARLAAPQAALTVCVAPAGAVLSSPPGTRVSLVALSADAVVTLRGLDYELRQAPLPADACLGVSNRITRPGAAVELHRGVVAAVVYDGDETFGHERQEAFGAQT